MLRKQSVVRLAQSLALGKKLGQSSSVLTNNVRTFADVKKEEPEPKKSGFVEKLWGLSSNEASPEFKNRWLMAAPAFITHMCIGSPYAWSLMADVLTREQGFVASSASDWSMMESAWPLSIVFLLQGLSGSIFGKWQLKVGPRKAMATAALAFGGGMALGAAGIAAHSLPLLYLGYGVLAGTGVGLGYTPPMQALLQWFPDKKGLATGLTVAGFGSGALVFTPFMQAMMKKFSQLPEYVGSAKDVVTTLVDGKLFATHHGKLVEVVQAGATELAKIPYDLAEGFYVVGSGSTGAAPALAAVGATYLSVILASSLILKRPHKSYVPEGMPVATQSATAAAPAVPDVTVDEAMKKPQFYLMGASFMCLASGGMGMFSVAKPMMGEVFSNALPQIVNSAFAAKYLLMLSAGSLAGRLGWAALSDIVGRKKTFLFFGLASIPLYLSLPTIINNVVTTGSEAQLYAFIASSVAAISIMGGTYSVLPAFEAELFGTSHIGPIHGRMLMFSSMAAIAGPTLLLKLRSISEKNAVQDLLSKISPEKFLETFGTPIENAMSLLETKTISIGKLLALCPPGTLDPTPFLYDSTMYTMAGLMCASALGTAMVRPLSRPVLDVPASAVKEIDSNGQSKDNDTKSSNATTTNASTTAGDRRVN